MSNYGEEEKIVLKRVGDFGPKPRSAKQALIQAHAFLSQEGTWTTGTMFEDGDPEEAYEKSSCGNWQACAMGALGLVTGEMPIKVLREWYHHDLKEQWQTDVLDGDYEGSLEDWIQERGHSVGDFSFVFNEEYDPIQTPLSFKAARVLARVINSDRGRARYGDGVVVEPGCDDGDVVGIVTTFNDGGFGADKRSQVLDTFEKAIRSLGGEPLVDHRKAKKAAAKRTRS